MKPTYREPGPDADEASGLRPKCPRCDVTIKGRVWYWRHRLCTCHPDRLATKARIRARAHELYSQEQPW
jgi:uncharacterized C2H2 Zn-finger protein